MRRLFSTFAGGLPGAGLVVMRLAATIVLIARSIAALHAGPALAPAAWPVLQFVLALLLAAGLWTPVSGILLVLNEVARLLAHTDDPWANLLLAALGLALTLLGPGAWSVDARLFGWRRIEVRHRQSRPPTLSR